MLATARREEGEEVCGLPGERRRQIGEFIINVGAQGISAAHRTPPSKKIGHFLVRLNGTSVVDWHAARTKIPACHEGNVRVETTAEGWSIFWRESGGG